MGVIWWGTGEGGGGACPHFWQCGGGGGGEYLMSPHIFLNGNKSRIKIFICVLRSFSLDLSGLHILTNYLPQLRYSEHEQYT